MKTLKITDITYRALDREAKKKQLTSDELCEILLKRGLNLK